MDGINGRVERVERVEVGRINGRVEVDRMGNCADELRALASKVGQVAYGVHEYFGNGLLEKVYETALEHRLIKEGYKVERQKPLKVYDVDGYCVGEYFVDLFVDDKLIVELKAAKNMAPEHLAQTLNYMKITGCPVALLINFGSYKFERRTVSCSNPST